MVLSLHISFWVSKHFTFKDNFFFIFIIEYLLNSPLSFVWVFLLILVKFASSFYSSKVFHTSFNWNYFHWRISDSKSLCPSRTLQSILVVLNSAVVWMNLILPLISNFSILLSKLLGTVLSVSTIISYPFYLHVAQFVRGFFCSLERFKYFIYHFIFFCLLQHNIHLLFFCISSIFASKWVNLRALFWAAIILLGFYEYKSMTPEHSKIFAQDLLAWMTSSTACRSQILGEVNCNHGFTFLTDYAQLTLVCCTVNKINNSKSQQFTHCSL